MNLEELKEEYMGMEILNPLSPNTSAIIYDIRGIPGTDKYVAWFKYANDERSYIHISKILPVKESGASITKAINDLNIDEIKTYNNKYLLPHDLRTCYECNNVKYIYSNFKQKPNGNFEFKCNTCSEKDALDNKPEYHTKYRDIRNDKNFNNIYKNVARAIAIAQDLTELLDTYTKDEINASISTYNYRNEEHIQHI